MVSTLVFVLVGTVVVMLTGRALGEALGRALCVATGRPVPGDALTRTQRYYQAMRFRDQLIDAWRLRYHAKLLSLEGPRRERRDAHVEIALLCMDAEEADILHTEVYAAVREVVGEAVQGVRDDNDLPSVEELAVRIRLRVLPEGHPRRGPDPLIRPSTAHLPG